ncbi:MAG TPA: response regulator transcription factor [Ktedonobacterales bacterium]|nr:response regulator transcription factor [Ktedonobacterales bacterium]
MATILVVEDEKDLCNLIRNHLEGEGHTVYQAFDGPSALQQVELHPPHLVILDWMLPGLDGLAVCRQIRQNHLMPILMLTARSEEVDRVLGLEVGADDYVVKPFGMRELLARVRAILRRVALDTRAPTPGQQAAEAGATNTLPAPEPIVRGPLSIDLARHTVTIEGAEIEVTPKEFDLLVLLASHPGRAFSREFLLEQIWGYEYDGLDRTVDTQITRLRKKLGPLSEKLVTVWGVGYRFML